MRRLILVFLLFMVMVCGGAARPLAAGPAAHPTPDHMAWLQAVKPGAVALNTAAEDLAVAYESRDVHGIGAKVKTVADAAAALPGAVEPNLGDAIENGHPDEMIGTAELIDRVITEAAQARAMLTETRAFDGDRR